MNFKKRVNGSWTDIPHYIHKTSTDTIATLPAVVYPNATTATVGLKGQTTQSGTPTPDNPIMPQGTGERTGNLWAGDVPRYSYAQDYRKYNPDNAIALKVGTYTISSDGKLPIIQVFNVNHTQLNVDDAITHTSGYYKMWDGLAIGPQSNALRTITVTLLSDCILTFAITDNLGTYIMLNLGSTPLPYEPYGIKIPISSANTTTPVYLGEVESTRQIKKLVLTGSVDENITLYTIATGNLFRIELPSLRRLAQFYGNGMCTHYRSVYRSADRINGTISGGDAAAVQGAVDIVDDYATVSDFKSYLQQQYAAGTPVTVWYVLATPETAVVNEPLRKIGDYADGVSNISIPVTAGGDTISVDTTLQPSEVTVNYKGWHSVADVHERDNGAWI